MATRPPDEQRSFLVQVLQVTSRSQGDREAVYSLLRANLKKLDDRFARLLRNWATEQFAKAEPAKAINIAKIVVKFSNLIRQFPQGNKDSNLEIAIAGCEAALVVFTQEAFPKDWGSIQQALASAYQQRQRILYSTIVQLKQETVETQTRSDTLIERLGQQWQQKLQQTNDQIEQLKAAIAQVDRRTSKTDITPIVSAIKELQSPTQPFNTAIFYDIENLVMGNRQPVFNFSLKEIIQKVKGITGVKQIAMQCAYANWSDSRLGRMRNDILELGIEPIQIFGFSPQKNAADIQIAIDAIELAHNRTSLEVFVIVSGDGAFASLAKKLHEYGKTVIGCIYERQINRVLKSVCDVFVPVTDPESGVLEELGSSNDRSESDVNIVARTKQVLKLLKHDIRMLRGGIVIPQVRNFLVENIENFENIHAKYAESVPDKRLTSLLKLACVDTDFEVDANPPAKLVLKNGANITDGNFHTAESYRQILMIGYKKFKLESSEDIIIVARCLVKNPLEREVIADASKRLTAIIGDRLGQETIQNCLLAFLSADCFETESETGALWKRVCTLKVHFKSERELLQALRDSVQKRLVEALAEIDEELDDNVLQKILP